MSSDAVLTRVDDGLLWITIDRAESRNALSREVRDGLWEALRRLRDDPDVGVAVLTGSGDRAFCAGGDLKEMSETGMTVPPPDFLPHLGRNIHTDKPLIAAVNGQAFGGGFLLAQMADLCIASDKAVLGITEARWGRGFPWAMPLLPLVPPRVALEMMVSAKPITAERAYEIGLVNRVVPASDLLDDAEATARTILANAPLTVRAAKRMVHLSLRGTYRDLFDEAEEIFRPVYLSTDAQEGPTAFRERRAPRWSGA
ncbi:enoyl-CoA hydratase/isomerase family protein [Pseudonocardia sp. McavD-2-B]|uniref:enoyl-CoA hydratase/isomerase family protein n=1 Tax=Pseudonocardia sp. McavD-2-B TaxID=2954499 RepID=UPI002096C5F8|nr:enoyl-CoA hydratase/isomerase family protein [Pseudonocardia sp. McavD-2-B]MCO7191512.1 enoyl-CoA hydratase/isomerase family protein [Pseudonocardia sp. McavD-2-B]